MSIALGLSRRGLGQSSPNPSVGCVILNKKSQIVGRGYTGRGGRPHAETMALLQAGYEAEGGTAYVTLEPCAHYGQTPPCAETLIKAKISRVVVATGDPDERVSGKGIAILKAAGIDVSIGICQDQADDINKGFFTLCTYKRPMVTMKLATSLDGKIATVTGQSKWITGAESRNRGHLLRANHDAILVGIGTVIADNPSLDCRLSGLQSYSPIRIILDSSLKISIDSNVVQTAKEIPTWVITTVAHDQKWEILENFGVKVIGCVADENKQIHLAEMLKLLGTNGITRLLCEGGAQVNASLIKASLVDRLYWFRSTKIIGGDGLSAIPSIGLNMLEEMPHFHVLRSGQTGNDIWQEFKIGH